jgi:molybdate transport system substrate-binding protein
MKRTIGALIGALTIAFVHSPHAAKSAEITLLCSNAFRPVVTALAPQFERSTGHKIVVRFMGTNLKPTIEAGEPFDVAISQSEVIESLVDQKKIGAGTNVAVANTPVGVAIRAGAPRPDIGSIEAFKRTLLKAKAVTYSGEGRAGLVVAEIFERLGIADQMKSKSILFGTLLNGLQVTFVLMGGIGASAKQPAAAKAFLAFLRTPEAATVIAARGMEAP